MSDVPDSIDGPEVPVARRPRRQFTVSNRRYRPAVRALDGLLSAGRRLGLLKLSVEDILGAARRGAGLQDWGDDAFVERLTQLVDSANRRPLTGLATFAARASFIKAVQNRLQIEAYARRHPEIADIPVQRPVFILGFPRTGTTLLQNLLSLTPGHRSLRFWELTAPVPRSEDGAKDRRKRMADAAMILRLAYFIAPEQSEIHAIGVNTAEECWPLFFNDFAVLNYDLTAGFTDFGDWLMASDMTGPYQYYRRQLQLMAHWQPTEQFLLKCPEHLWFLKALTTVFPDACIVWTHRDPVASVASYSSLASLNYRMVYGRIDPEVIGAHTRQRFHLGVQRAMEARALLGEDRFFDVGFVDLVRDPLSMVRRIRAHFDLPQPPGSQEAMAAFLANKRSDARGSHVYSAEQWGLDPAAVRAEFDDYIQRFDIHLETPR